MIVISDLNVVEPGVDVVVLLHEVIEAPDLGTESRQHVPLVPGQVSGINGRVEVVGGVLLDLKVILPQIFQYWVLGLWASIKSVIIIILE